MHLMDAPQPLGAACDPDESWLDLERDLAGDRAGILEPPVDGQPRKGRNPTGLHQCLEQDRGVSEPPVATGGLGTWRLLVSHGVSHPRTDEFDPLILLGEPSGEIGPAGPADEAIVV